MITRGLDGRLIKWGLVGLSIVIAVVVEWIDRRTEPAIMRKRVNSGSDRYLEERGSVWEAATRKERSLFGPNE